MASGQRRGLCRSPSPTPAATRGTSRAAPVRDGDEYVVNGAKAWVTNGERAAIVALAARAEEGISTFIVEKEPGPQLRGNLGVSKHVGKLGYQGVETVDMAYADHRIPAANLVGEPGRGLPQILGVLEVGRHQYRRPCRRRRPAPPSTPPWPMPSGDRLWASPSASTRPSS